MSKTVTNTIILVMLGVLLCEAHTWVQYAYPEIATKQIDLWIDRAYHFKLSVAWYIYELENRLAMVIWFYAFANVCRSVSKKLFKAMVVFVTYFFTQAIFWMWDRNTVFFTNFIVYAYMLVAIIYLLVPEKSTGRVVSLK